MAPLIPSIRGKNMFGIKETELIYAEYLDIEGNDAEKILSKAIRNITE